MTAFWRRVLIRKIVTWKIMKKSPIAIALSLILFQSCFAADLYFPPEFFGSDKQAVADLSHFTVDGAQMPGNYQVDVFLNDEPVGVKIIAFTSRKSSGVSIESAYDNTGLTPCLSARYIQDLGVKSSLYPLLSSAADDECITLDTLIPDAYTKFNFTGMRLDISIPQASLYSKAQGYIDPELWDEGINAALLNYNFSTWNRSGSGHNDSSYYLNLNSGLNIGAWRLRDYRTWNYYDNAYDSGQQWQRIKTYVERTIPTFRSNLVMGESTTEGTVFDSIGFRGIQVATDDNMYPDSMRGFAPVIRGMAESNAQVYVRQNGYTIYQTNVAPGAFEIDDLLPVYSSGDLEVTVHEAAGNIRVFTVPYSSVPLLQREGRHKYSLTAGRFSSASDHYDDPEFVQGTLLWGLPHNLTTYGGIQYSNNYFAAQIGTGVNMGRLGAVSADITHADSTLADGSTHKGQSVRFLYSHAFSPTGTTLHLTGYRYSTQGFHTLDETALKDMQGRLYDHDLLDENGYPAQGTHSDFYNLYNSKRARMEVNISQQLGQVGSLYVTGMRQTYWRDGEANDSLLTGLSSAIGPFNYSVGYGYSHQKTQHGEEWKDHTVNLSLSVPLDRLFSPLRGGRSVYATFNSSRDNHGNLSQQAGLSGTALETGNLSWNVSQGYTRHQGNSGNAGVNYRGGYGNANAGYSYSSDYQQLSYGFSGGAILHRDGLTLGQPLGDTSVLVAAPGAAGVQVDSAAGVTTDWRGYAIKPYASAYRENRISLDTSSVDDETEVDSTVNRVIPTKGAVVKAGFKVQSGYRMLMTLKGADGRALPFGTLVSAGENSSIVGDDGQVYLSGMPDKGQLKASWGSDTTQQCTVDFHINAVTSSEPIIRMTELCR
ncbi:fimbria/pilus outer membrane usher protein [Aeromonas caviae]|uniref:fimbria/pilus outer membrane usher protein n=1 Tax=Aeromonas caviae TaxID=648 RepID=UPI002B45F51F|nr:fimbria/pilus outer membrane usher protein [Aeromonas caviae]